MNSKAKFLLKIISKVLFIAVLIVFIITVIKLPDNLNYFYRPGEEPKFITIFNMKIPLDVANLKSDVANYIKTLLSGSFGTTTANKPVLDYIKSGLPRTITILVASVIVSIVLAINPDVPPKTLTSLRVDKIITPPGNPSFWGSCIIEKPSLHPTSTLIGLTVGVVSEASIK